MSAFKLKGRSATTPFKRSPKTAHNARAYTIEALAELDDISSKLPKSNVSLLCTEGLDAATARCKETVERLSLECRARNQRYRDVEFDLLQDRELCLHGLLDRDGIKYTPTHVKRVHEIFESPKFFVEGPDASDIKQGNCGNCWFLSGLATVAAVPNLLERICVARDEKCGIYGFIFFRENTWTEVIVDDQLFVLTPEYEQLDNSSLGLFKRDKTLYNRVARQGSQTLYFSRCINDNETWVPLIEKAYAKLHGDYAALSGGFASDAIEDLTGGLAFMSPITDILDVDLYWQEQLSRVTKDRLFATFIRGFKKVLPPNPPKDGEGNVIEPADVDEVEGLVTGHSFAVVKAVQFNGKRFVKLRNPWAKGEWKGPWSDGSREWTAEWIGALKALDYSFGDDGEFIMEYTDFLRTWGWVDRVRLFDEKWVLAQEWLDAKTRPFPSSWTYGDISFTIDITTATEAVICLSSTDVRYYYGLEGHVKEAFDFSIFKAGEKMPLASSPKTQPQERSTKIETILQPGRYVIHVRIDRYMFRSKEYLEQSSYSYRKFARVYKTGTHVAMTASNFNYGDIPPHLRPNDVASGYTISEMEQQALDALRHAGVSQQQILLAQQAEAHQAAEFHMAGQARPDMPPPITDEPATEEPASIVSEPSAPGSEPAPAPEPSVVIHEEVIVQEQDSQPAPEPQIESEGHGGEATEHEQAGVEQHEQAEEQNQQVEAEQVGLPESVNDDEITITFGLRVYTHDKNARVEGQLRKLELPWGPKST